MIPTFIDRLLIESPAFVSRRYRGFKSWRWGERELHLLPTLCDRKKCSVDVGAHCGTYAYFIGKASLHCLAFEPNTTLHGQLKAQAVNTTVYSCALSDHRYSAELRIPKREGRLRLGCATIEPENRLTTETENELIEVRTLDSFELTNVGFIKIDAEGHELSVLKGAIETLRTSHPRLLLEAEDRHRPNAVSSVVRFLDEMGYFGLFLNGNKLEPVSNFDATVHQHPDAPVYIANFIFLHRTDTSVLQSLSELSLSRSRVALNPESVRSAILRCELAVSARG